MDAIAAPFWSHMHVMWISWKSNGLHSWSWECRIGFPMIPVDVHLSLNPFSRIENPCILFTNQRQSRDMYIETLCFFQPASIGCFEDAKVGTKRHVPLMAIHLAKYSANFWRLNALNMIHRTAKTHLTCIPLPASFISALESKIRKTDSNFKFLILGCRNISTH